MEPKSFSKSDFEKWNTKRLLAYKKKLYGAPLVARSDMPNAEATQKEYDAMNKRRKKEKEDLKSVLANREHVEKKKAKNESTEAKKFTTPKTPKEAYSAWKKKNLQVQGEDGKWGNVVGVNDTDLKSFGGFWWKTVKDRLRILPDDFEGNYNESDEKDWMGDVKKDGKLRDTLGVSDDKKIAGVSDKKIAASIKGSPRTEKQLIAYANMTGGKEKDRILKIVKATQA